MCSTRSFLLLDFRIRANMLAGIHQIVFGTLIVAFLLFEPRGLAEIWRRIARGVAGLAVPLSQRQPGRAMTALLEIEGLEVVYGHAIRAIQGVSFSVGGGQHRRSGRPQRRRQDHDHPRHFGISADRERADHRWPHAVCRQVDPGLAPVSGGPPRDRGRARAREGVRYPDGAGEPRAGALGRQRARAARPRASRELPLGRGHLRAVSAAGASAPIRMRFCCRAANGRCSPSAPACCPVRVC